MKYFYLILCSLGLLLILTSGAEAKIKIGSNESKGNALGIEKQEIRDQSEESKGNSGSIWTTNSNGSQQDKNHYQSGDNLFLHGQKLPEGALSYTIYTNPPSAKKGSVVKTGTVSISEDGQLSPTLIWNIPTDAHKGVYKVVLITGSHKSDNFKIKGTSCNFPCGEKPPVPPCPPPVQPPITPPASGGGQGGGPILVAQAAPAKTVLGMKTLPKTGPNNYLSLIIAALTVGLYLGIKRILD